MLKGKAKEAIVDFQLAVAAGERLVQLAPDNFTFRSDLTYRYSELSRAQRQAGDPVAAIATARKGLVILEELVLRDPSNKVWARRLATAHGSLGRTYFAKEDLAQAKLEFQASVKGYTALSTSDPDNEQISVLLVNERASLGQVEIELGETDAGIQLITDAAGAAEKRLSASPDEMDRIDSAASTVALLAQAQFRHGNPALAVTQSKRAVELLERVVAKKPKEGNYAHDLARMRAQLGRALVAAKSYPEAVEVLRVAAPAYRAMVASKPTDDEYRYAAMTGIALGDALRETGAAADAKAAYQDAAADRDAGLKLAPDSKELQAMVIPKP